MIFSHSSIVNTHSIQAIYEWEGGLARPETRNLIQSISFALEVELSCLEQTKLLKEAIIRVRSLPLSLDELECILKRHREDSHDEHDDGGCRARHSHGAVDQALRTEVLILSVNYAE